MRGAFAAMVIGLGLLVSSPGTAQKHGQPAGHGPPPPPPPAACTCGNIKDLQGELKVALMLRDKFGAQAKLLREKYGDNPQDYDLSDARKDYQAFAGAPEDGKPAAPGSARDGLTDTSSIAYQPVGARLRDRGARGFVDGIELAKKFDKNHFWVPDLEKRKQIEDEHRKAGNDLCNYEDEAGLDKAAQKGAACAAVAKAVRTHEDTHQKTCRRLGFYAFDDRHPAQLAEDEVLAYQAQIDVLAAELRKILLQKKTKITSGKPGATAESLVDIEARCVLAFTVVGGIDDLRFNDKVCDSAEAFTVKTSPNANFKFTPSDEKTGTYAYNGRIVGAQFYGNGGYVLELKDGKGTLRLDGSGGWHVKAPMGNPSKRGPETLRATELPNGCV